MMGMMLNRRLFLPEVKEVENFYSNLVSKDNTNVPFSTFKDLFMFALVLGYSTGNSAKNNKKQEINLTVFKLEDIAIITSIALIESNEDTNILLKEVNGKTKEDIAEEYASTGIKRIVNKILENPNKKYIDIIEEFMNYKIEKEEKRDIIDLII